MTQKLDLTRDNPQGNLSIQQGATFNLQLAVYNDDGTLTNLTGYSAAMKIKYHAGHPDTLASWSSGGGQFILNGAAGTIDFSVSDTETAALDWLGLAHYDLLLTSAGGEVTRLAEGIVELARSIT